MSAGTVMEYIYTHRASLTLAEQSAIHDMAQSGRVDEAWVTIQRLRQGRRTSDE